MKISINNPNNTFKSINLTNIEEKNFLIELAKDFSNKNFDDTNKFDFILTKTQP